MRFETIYDPEGMPGFKASPWYEWPYIEGLRMDEAMHDLAILSTGLYGEELLPQNGAPIPLLRPIVRSLRSATSSDETTTR